MAQMIEVENQLLHCQYNMEGNEILSEATEIDITKSKNCTWPTNGGHAAIGFSQNLQQGSG